MSDYFVDLGAGITLNIGRNSSNVPTPEEISAVYNTSRVPDCALPQGHGALSSLTINSGVMGELIDGMSKVHMASEFREFEGFSRMDLEARLTYAAFCVRLARNKATVVSNQMCHFIIGLHVMGASCSNSDAYPISDDIFCDMMQNGDEERDDYPETYSDVGLSVKYFMSMLLMFVAKPVVNLKEATWNKTHDDILTDLNVVIDKPKEADFQYFYSRFFDTVNILYWAINQLKAAHRLNSKYHAYMCRLKVVFGYVSMIVKALKLAPNSRIYAKIPQDQRQRVFMYLKLIQRKPFISHHQHREFASVSRTITHKSVEDLSTWAYFVLTYYKQLGTYLAYKAKNKTGTFIASEESVHNDCKRLDEIEEGKTSGYYHRLSSGAAELSQPQMDGMAIVGMYSQMVLD